MHGSEDHSQSSTSDHSIEIDDDDNDANIVAHHKAIKRQDHTAGVDRESEIHQMENDSVSAPASVTDQPEKIIHNHNHLRHSKQGPSRGIARSRSSNRLNTTSRRSRRDRDWGNASLPAVTIDPLDLVEDKKNGITNSPPTTTKLSSSSSLSSSMLRSNKLRQRKVVRDGKDNRRREVKNSLFHFLHETTGDENENDGEDDHVEEAEDETIISGLLSLDDDDAGETEESKSSEVKISSDQAKHNNVHVPKSPTTPSRSRRKVQPGSVVVSHDREDHDDNRSVQSKMKRRGPRRHHTKSTSHDHDGDDVSVGSRKIGRSRSSRVPGTTSGGRRGRGGKDDDEQSVRSSSVGHNANRRHHHHHHHRKDHHARRRGSNNMEPEHKTNEQNHQVESIEQSKSEIDGLEDAGEGCKPHKGDKVEQKEKTLSDHIEPQGLSSSVDRVGVEEGSEASSRVSFSYVYQDTVLQFDPTSAGFVNEVKQDTEHVSSEIIRYNGTEEKVEIRELAGALPSFENPKVLSNEESTSCDVIHHHDLSIDIEGTTSLNDDIELSPRKPSSTLSIESQSSTQSEPVHESPRNRFKKNNTRQRGGVRAVTTSFLERRRKHREEAQEDLNSSTTSFFSLFHKKDENEDDSSDEERPRSMRWGKKKRTPKNMQHQSLDDNGSNH